MVDAIVYTEDPILGALVRHRVKLIGFKANSLSDRSEFIDALHQHPCVAIIDLDLADGFPVIEQISGDEATSHTPILCLSTKGELALAERAYRCGAKAFLLTPFDPQLLERKVRSLTEHKLNANKETSMLLRHLSGQV